MKVAILGIFIALIALSGICMATPVSGPAVTVVSGTFACTPSFAASPSTISLPNAGPDTFVQSSSPVVATISGICGSSANWMIEAQTEDGTGKMHNGVVSPTAGFKVYSDLAGWKDMAVEARPVILDQGLAIASHTTNVYFGQFFAASDDPGTYTVNLDLVASGTGF